MDLTPIRLALPPYLPLPQAGDFEGAILAYENVPSVLGSLKIGTPLGPADRSAFVEQTVKALGNAAQAYLSLESAAATAPSPPPKGGASSSEASASSSSAASSAFSPQMRVVLARLGVDVEAAGGEALSLARYAQVVKHCSDALEIDGVANATGSRDKLRYRRGVALVALGKYEGAVIDLTGLPDAPAQAKLREARVGQKRAEDKAKADERRLWGAAFGSPAPGAGAGGAGATPAKGGAGGGAKPTTLKKAASLSTAATPATAAPAPASDGQAEVAASAAAAAAAIASEQVEQVVAAPVPAPAAADEAAAVPVALGSPTAVPVDAAPAPAEAVEATATPVVVTETLPAPPATPAAVAPKAVTFVESVLPAVVASPTSVSAQPLSPAPLRKPAAAVASSPSLEDGCVSRTDDDEEEDADVSTSSSRAGEADGEGEGESSFRRTFVGRTPHPKSRLGASLTTSHRGDGDEEQQQQEEGGQGGQVAALASTASSMMTAALEEEAGAAPAAPVALHSSGAGFAQGDDTQTLLMTRDEDSDATSGLSPLLLGVGAAILGAAAIGAMVYMRRR